MFPDVVTDVSIVSKIKYIFMKVFLDLTLRERSDTQSSVIFRVLTVVNTV